MFLSDRKKDNETDDISTKIMIVMLATSLIPAAAVCLVLTYIIVGF